MDTEKDRENNICVDDSNENGVEMAERKKKRIHNPKTGTYYSVYQRTTKKGRKGQIKGKWKPPKK